MTQTSPPANMQSLMAQLQSAQPNSPILGSGWGAPEPPPTPPTPPPTWEPNPSPPAGP